MKEKKKANQIKFMMMLCAVCMSTFLFGLNAKAATSGEIPCSEGQVTWELDENKVLTFSGNGTTNITSGWRSYWDRILGTDKYLVSEVKVTPGSRIKLNSTAEMFYYFERCHSIDLSGFITEDVVDMSRMFACCHVLYKLDVSGLDTRNVINMNSMFYDCKALGELDVSNFDTKNVTNMNNMFGDCGWLEELDVSNFNTRNVTNMWYMFGGCSKLKKLNVSNFDTKKVTDMALMFYMCNVLEELDINHFDTENVTNMRGMFYSCSNLKELDVSNFNTKNVTDMGIMFSGCSALEDLDLSNFDTKNVTSAKDIIRLCNALEIFETPKTPFVVKLPAISEGQYWVDTERNFYSPEQEYNFQEVTEIHRVKETYQIEYESKGELIDCPTTYKVTEGIAKLGTATRPDYIFLGWYLEEDDKVPVTAIEKGTFGDLVLYAKWKAKTDSIEEVITNNGDNDIKGSSFSMIQARADKTTKNSIRLKWNKVKDADGYMVYGNKCNPKNKYELIKTIENGSTTTFTHKKIKKGTYYKYTIYAYKYANGKREKVAVSKTIHGTTKGNKYGNAQSVKVNKTKITLKKNKTFKLKCKEVAEKGKKLKKHRAVCYESGNTQIATVTKKGVIKAKKKGTCYVYAYAQNGVYKKIKVTVK